MQATKGLPYVDEETRYYGMLELLEEMHARGMEVSEHLRRAGRLIQQSHDATSRTYAGHTWEWLLRVAATADLSLALDLTLSLEDDLDDAVPCAREGIFETLRVKKSPLPLSDWVALAWAAGVDRAEDGRKLATVAVERLTNSGSSADAERWRNWAAGALAGGLHSGGAAEVRAAVCIGTPPKVSEGADAVRSDAYSTLQRIVGDAQACDRASGGDPTAIRRVIDRIAEWLDEERGKAPDSAELKPGSQDEEEQRRLTRLNLGYALRQVAEVFFTACEEDQLGKLKAVYSQMLSPWRAFEIDVYLARRLQKNDPVKSRELARSTLEHLKWYDQQEMPIVWQTLADIDEQSAKADLVRYVAESGIEPYLFVETLRHLPRAIVTDESTMGILEAYFRDIEDSLSVLPSDPKRRDCIEENAPPCSRTVEEFLRDLLHRRDRDLRRRAREALGILAHERPQQVATALAQWGDLAAVPPYERLSGEEERLAALWSVAEINAAAVTPSAQGIYHRFVAPDAPCGGHFKLREMGRRVCLSALRGAPTVFSKPIVGIIRHDPIPAKLTTMEEDRRGAKSWLVDHDLEYEVERLSNLFGLSGRFVERVADRVVNRLHQLTEGERKRDRRMAEWRYSISPRSLQLAYSELFRHALRILQQRWYERRPANMRQWEDATPAYFEARTFDPWLPALLVGQCEGLDVCDAELDRALEDSAWLKEPLPDLPTYLMREGWVLLNETIEAEHENRRCVSWVSSCLAEEKIARGLLRQRPEKIRLPKRDLPPYAYIMEIDGDLDWWWSRWRYGENTESGHRLLSAYACDSVADRAEDMRLVRPTPILLPSCFVKRSDRGLEFGIEGLDESVWLVEWIADRGWRAWAQVNWLTRRLQELDLWLLVSRCRERIILGPPQGTASLRFYEKTSELWSSGLMDQQGAWTERPRRSPRSRSR
jgi:hypothetical protein